MSEEDLETIRRVMEAPRYAVMVVCDQTIAYVTKSCGETTRHPEAMLWDTREEAFAAAIVAGYGSGNFDIEEILDEDEFRAREDTW